MKKSMHFRSWLLPVFLLVAAIVAGSCSKGEFLEPDATPADGQTRAAASIEMYPTPAGVGEGQAYFELNKIYRFNFYVTLPPGAINPSVSPNLYLQGKGVSFGDISNQGMDVLFTAPGVYDIKVYLMYKLSGGLQGTAETSKTCRVMSPVSSISGPSSVVLGGAYNFKVNFKNPDLPDPTLSLKITESAFNDPKYTILSNDGVGNYLIRFDEPGAYKIEPDYPYDKFFIAPSYYVDVFFRPHIKADSRGISMVGSDEVTYDNRLYLCDPQTQIAYSYLPFRVYFTYKLCSGRLVEEKPIARLPQDVPTVTGVIRRNVGSSLLFGINMPISTVGVNYIVYTNSDLPQRIPRDYYWEIGIPKDAGRSGNWESVIEGELKPEIVAE